MAMAILVGQNGEHPLLAQILCIADSTPNHLFKSWLKERHISFVSSYMGVSENSVPLNLMVNDHYPY